jgi:hypothetical protein
MGSSQSAEEASKGEVFICGLHAAYPEPTVDDRFMKNVTSNLGMENEEQ